MPYEINQKMTFPYPFKEVYQAAYLCAKQLGGKITKSEPEQKILHAQMDKRMKGEMLGDRSNLEMRFEVDESEHTTVYIFAYPLNAVGQKLMFGARKGVVDKAISIFFEEVQKHLQEKN